MSGLHVRRHEVHQNLHAVFRDETRVSGWQLIDLTQGILDRMLRRESGRMRKRKCLCCGNTFISEGPHHRLCKYHRATIGGLGREMVG
jgi:hypothetical protein